MQAPYHCRSEPQKMERNLVGKDLSEEKLLEFIAIHYLSERSTVTLACNVHSFNEKPYYLSEVLIGERLGCGLLCRAHSQEGTENANGLSISLYGA
jgi:hypothetical protein